MTDYSMATHAVGVQTMRNPHVRPPIAGTAADDRDMKRMKKPQELNVSPSRMPSEVHNKG
jgi:hypothetical protein